MVHVLAMIHAGSLGRAGLRAYEEKVLAVLDEHGGSLLSAFEPEGSDSVDCPDEIHLLEFPSMSALEAYRSDPRVVALSEERLAAIAETTVLISKEIVSYGVELYETNRGDL